MNFENIERITKLESSSPVYILKITNEKLKGTLEESLVVYRCKHMSLDYLKKYISFDKKQRKKRSEDLLDKNRAEAVYFLSERIIYLEEMLNNRMNNILTDNKSIKEMSNRQFVNHIFETSTVHEVVLMKIIDDGIKATLNNKEKIFKQWEEASEQTKKDFIINLGLSFPAYFTVIKEIETAYNIKYNSK